MAKKKEVNLNVHIYTINVSTLSKKKKNEYEKLCDLYAKKTITYSNDIDDLCEFMSENGKHFHLYQFIPCSNHFVETYEEYYEDIHDDITMCEYEIVTCGLYPNMEFFCTRTFTPIERFNELRDKHNLFMVKGNDFYNFCDLYPTIAKHYK